MQDQNQNEHGEAEAALERELERLRPAVPPAGLEARLAQALEKPARWGRWAPEEDRAMARARILRLWVAPMAAAATVAASLGLVWFWSQQGGGEASGLSGGRPEAVEVEAGGRFIEKAVARFQPESAQTVLYDLRDEGIVWNEANEPMRQFRYLFLDTVSLTNPADGSTLRMEVPREQVVRVPVETF